MMERETHTNAVNVEIRDLEAARMPEALGAITRGMRDNPMQIASLGDAPGIRERKLRSMFDAIAASEELGRDRQLLAALGSDGSILGVLGMQPPGRCQPGLGQQLRVVPALLGLGPRRAGRVMRWLGAWSKHDPRERHWHLGPVAVDAHLQGRGVGSALMRVFCERMDAAGEVAYLETDKEINVSFYERFGFEVIGEEEVLGVPNWFMIRRPEDRR